MKQTVTIREKLANELNKLPLEVLPELQTFVKFLQFKTQITDNQPVGHDQRNQWLSALEATFGMWADRDDMAGDGVAYVQTIRRGHRLNDFLERIDETD